MSKVIRNDFLLKLAFFIATLILIMGIFVVFTGSRAEAASRTVAISCAQDIDSIINSDPVGTTTRFNLDDSCAHITSAELHPEDGDEITCETAPTATVLFGSNPATEPTAYDPLVDCQINGSSGIDNVLKPQDTFFMEGVRVNGGTMTYNGTGTGAGIAEGQMANDSWIQYSIVRNTPALGIANAHGVHHGIELDDTTNDPNALGITGSGIKGVDEFNIQHSFIHDNQGNGIWCDVHCDDVSGAPFSVAHFNSNLVVDNGRAGIRWERIGRVNCGTDCDPTSGQAIIENNRVAGNGWDAVRGGIDVRDAQDAQVRNNVIGSQTVGGVAYGNNVNSLAVRVTDSGRTDRPDLFNIDVYDNDLTGGETITGCSLPDSQVDCMNNN